MQGLFHSMQHKSLDLDTFSESMAGRLRGRKRQVPIAVKDNKIMAYDNSMGRMEELVMCVCVCISTLSVNNIPLHQMIFVKPHAHTRLVFKYM